MKKKEISKKMWRCLWKAYDMRKKAIAAVKACHDSLSMKARRNIILAMLALFALLALYTAGKSLYNLLHYTEREQLRIEHMERLEIIDSSPRKTTIKQSKNYDKTEYAGRPA